ncbi:MAG TPA: DedA family protein [Vicinamibacterales bacterium]|jgi:membrane-associated protein
MPELVEYVLHFDRHLADLVNSYGPWVYGLLFVIIFAETGLVVTPFLPGDSLLFAAGALAATSAFDPWILTGVLFLAAFTGNAVNYSIGRAIGPRVFRETAQSGLMQKLLNRRHLDRAHAFFEAYGGKAVILGRFVPIVRTFVPFVAGAAQMTPRSFALYNFVGAGAWVGICIGGGLLFGNVPIVKNNFPLVALGIVIVSLLPALYEYLKHRRARSARRRG